VHSYLKDRSRPRPIALGKAPRLVVVALDSAELSQITGFVARGLLPEIARLLDEGIQSEVMTTSHHVAEVPWTEMLTGCTPATTGYWGPVGYATDYTVTPIAAYDFTDKQPFYAYCGDRRAIVLDVPQARLCDAVKGVQLLGWGSHAPYGPSVSHPARLLPDILDRFGAHPVFPHDWMMVTDPPAKAKRLEAGFLDGIERRTEICLHLMAQHPWDLVFVVFAEPHAAGHNFWHLGDYGHVLDTPTAGTADPMLRIFQEIDRSIGRLRAAAPDARFMLFSERGMKPNSCDLASLVFLPELLYRHSFGQPALLPARPGPVTAPDRGPYPDWGLAVWATQQDENPVRRAIRRHARPGLSRRIDTVFGSPCGLQHPYAHELGYLPPTWYAPHWPRMSAFALPSSSDGLVRINLRGREQKGIVAPEDYDAACDTVEALLRDLRDSRDGRPVVDEIVRTNGSGPDADLVVKWVDEPFDTVTSPTHGRMGPVPFRRAGDHNSRGFFVIGGAEIPVGRLPAGRLVDLAPTILDLMEVEIPAHFEGASLLASVVETT
jgi:predicted AlkP superfamily phosphohydrolase/phosphomutase